jgi:hypothetical protein
MDIYEAVISRRSVRGFKDRPVSREVLAPRGLGRATGESHSSACKG